MKKLEIFDLRTQSLINPLGIDERPIFSYKLRSTLNNVLQKSYRIEVSKHVDFTNHVWESKVNSGESIAIMGINLATAWYNRHKVCSLIMQLEG